MKDLGIDLGTANILIYIKGEGIVLNEPSVVAIDMETKKPLAFGSDANLMLGKTPFKVKAIRPMKDGVIADFQITEMMLDYFVNKIKARGIFKKPRIVICCPADTTPVEKNAIKEAAEKLGAKKVYLEEEPKAAAIGVGLDISKPNGNMIIDIGGGTTDIAVLSLGGIVVSRSLKIAGNVFDNDIKEYIKNKYRLLIGDKTASTIKHEIGSVYESDDSKMEVRGRDLETGLPSIIEISSSEIEEALEDDAQKIVVACKSVLEETPPELSADIIENGAILTGGGSLLNGFKELLEAELKIPIFLAESPLTSVAEGTGIMLDNLYMLD
ncbi:MAG: rod shape-determining protein [Erysipelotrichaceae bacterium]|mgnify:CR=1 FL=1|nr:rod shape-determining protein [Erysipelotrichaceae bacterium]